MSDASDSIARSDAIDASIRAKWGKLPAVDVNGYPVAPTVTPPPEIEGAPPRPATGHGDGGAVENGGGAPPPLLQRVAQAERDGNWGLARQLKLVHLARLGEAQQNGMEPDLR